jgi:hypothetical protein
VCVCLSKRRRISTLDKTGRYHEPWYEYVYDAIESQSSVKQATISNTNSEVRANLLSESDSSDIIQAF